MKKIFTLFFAVIGTASAYTLSAQSYINPLDPASGFNVFTKESFTATSGQIGGPVAIGSTLILKGNATIAANSNGLYPTKTLNHTNNLGLVVAGQMSYVNGNSSSYVNRGFIRLGDVTSTTIWATDQNNNAANLRLTKARSSYNDNPRLELQRQQAANTVTQAHGLNFSEAFNLFAQSATLMNTYNTDGSLAPYINKITIPTTSNPAITLAENKINYIYLTQDQLTNLNNQGGLTFRNKPTATSPVVFNVQSSASYQWTPANIAGISGTDGAYMIWNFPSATSLTIRNGNAIYGTVFAPTADIIKNSPNLISGQLIGLSLKLEGGSIEYIPFAANLIEPAVEEQAILPLRSMELNAQLQNEKVKLTWLVRGEQEISNYVVEKSQDGRSFTTAGMVFSAGNNEQYTYRFTDAAKEAAATVVYYRIKAQEELNGKIYYSNVIAIRPTGAANTQVQLWPNPVVEQLTVSYTANSTANITVQLLDMSQRLVKHNRFNADKGTNQFSIANLGSLPSGVYMLKIVDETNGAVVSTHKVVK